MITQWVADPASWLDAQRQMATDFNHMKLDAAWFITVTPRATAKSK
jgi:hypothetical protein